MMKKFTKCILGTLLSGLAITVTTACNGSSGGTKEKFEISISARSLLAEQQMLKIWKTRYEELHPNVTVKIDGWGSNEGTSESYIMKNALNRSYLTNIIYTTDDTTAYIAQLKNLVDLRPYYESSAETDYTKYYSSMLDLTSFYGEFRPTTSYTGSYVSEKSDDAQYGVYFAPREYNMPGMLCNVTLFKNCFATQEEKDNWDNTSLRKLLLRLADSNEWNWEALVKALQAISQYLYQKIDVDKDTKYYAYRGIEMNNTWEPVYTTIIKELGSDGLFKEDEETYEVACNMGSSKNVAVYNKIIEQFGTTKDAKTNPNKYMIDTDYGNSNFGYQNIFMTVVSYPEVANYYEAFKKSNMELEFINFPCEYVAAGCGGYGILVDKAEQVQKIKSGETAKTADLCWDFIKFIISEEGQNLAGEGGYIQPVLKSLASTGDWLKSYDEKLDHSAFCTAKELSLDSFTFATPKTRSSLRTEVTSFFREIFSPNCTSYNSLLDTCTNSVNEILSKQ